MGVQGILSAIEREVAQEVQELEHDAELRIAEILREAGQRVELETERFVADRIDREERLRTRKVHSARVASSRAIADVRHGVFERLFDEATGRLAEMRPSPGYPDLLEALIADAATGICDACTIHVDPADLAIAEDVARKMGGGVSAVADIQTIGGAVVSSADGRVARDNTFEARLGQLRDGCAQQIWEVLEG